MTSPSIYSQSRLQRKGFSLIELLVVLAIFATILSIGFFMSLDSYRSYLFHSEQNTLANILERARSLAMSNSYESPWGVCFDASSQYVLFSGTQYSAGAANTAFIPSQRSTAVSGLPACASGGITFTQLSGTTTPANITVTQNGHSKTITINYEGRIDY